VLSIPYGIYFDNTSLANFLHTVNIIDSILFQTHCAAIVFFYNYNSRLWYNVYWVIIVCNEKYQLCSDRAWSKQLYDILSTSNCLLGHGEVKVCIARLRCCTVTETRFQCCMLLFTCISHVLCIVMICLSAGAWEKGWACIESLKLKAISIC